MASAAVDMNVTVTHGFFVRKDSSLQHFQPLARAAESDRDATGTPSPPAPPPAAASWREEGGTAAARGLLSGLSSVAPPLPAAQAPSAPATSSAAAAAGSLQVGDHAHLSSGCKRLLKSVVRGLKACQDPEAATEGLGGTYFFMNELGCKIAIMKPCDEEPMAPNNPKGFVGRQLGEPGLKPTVRVGEAASREVSREREVAGWEEGGWVGARHPAWGRWLAGLAGLGRSCLSRKDLAGRCWPARGFLRRWAERVYLGDALPDVFPPDLDCAPPPSSPAAAGGCLPA